MHLTLLIPELIWPEPDDRDTLDALDCPALDTLLARSRLTRRPPLSLEATLSDAFGHPEGAPYAAFRRLGEAAISPEAEDEEAFWIAADPVHLRFHQERLILADSARLDITEDEAEVLVGELNRQLGDSGCFRIGAAGRWYLRLNDAQLIADSRADQVPPLSAVAGRSVERLLPAAGQARTLRRLLNEVQMLLHAHPLNLAREEAGRMTINSLWLWGAGPLPGRRESDYDGLWSTHPLAIGLARAAGVPTHPVPDQAETFFAHAAGDTRHLVVLDDLLGPVHDENGSAYRQALQTLDRRWFAPLRAALAAGRLKQLRLVASTAYATLDWDSTRLEQWAIWRRPRPLAALAKELAGKTP